MICPGVQAKLQKLEANASSQAPPSQPHSYLLQLVDTLLHAADGGQRAECLGVQTPEAVLPADLEECYDPTLLPRKKNGT